MTTAAISRTIESDKKTILIVDDEPDIVTYLATLLEDNGYRVIQTRSAGEAADRLRDTVPDLITLDIMMPKRSGIAFYRDLKMDERTKNVPAIFISAFSLARDFTGSGFRTLIPEPEVPEPEAFVEKPIEVSKLLRTIESVIG